MTKSLTYTGFALASLVLAAAFVTSKTYTQLGVAVAVYPLLIFFAYRLFVHNDRKVQPTIVQPQDQLNKQDEEVNQEKVEVVTDLNKRAFLKIVGATGLSFFLISLFGRRIESLFLNRTLDTGIGPIGFPEDQSVTGGISESYKISEIDDASTVTYYGFVNKQGAWFIMKEDVESNSYRYVRSGTDFSNNWVNRENLKYDYYYNLF